MTTRVLVVDDEQDFLQSIVKRLQLRGFDALGAGSGEAALAVLEGLEEAAQSPVDVVVLDIRMPGLDGLKVLRLLRARHPSVEVIVLTGHGSQEFSDQGLELGAFDYLIKPVKLDEVIERILAAADARASGDQR